MTYILEEGSVVTHDNKSRVLPEGVAMRVHSRPNIALHTEQKNNGSFRKAFGIVFPKAFRKPFSISKKIGLNNAIFP